MFKRLLLAAVAVVAPVVAMEDNKFGSSQEKKAVAKTGVKVSMAGISPRKPLSKKLSMVSDNEESLVYTTPATQHLNEAFAIQNTKKLIGENQYQELKKNGGNVTHKEYTDKTITAVQKRLEALAKNQKTQQELSKKNTKLQIALVKAQSDYNQKN